MESVNVVVNNVEVTVHASDGYEDDGFVEVGCDELEAETEEAAKKQVLDDFNDKLDSLEPGRQLLVLVRHYGDAIGLVAQDEPLED